MALRVGPLVLCPLGSLEKPRRDPDHPVAGHEKPESNFRLFYFWWPCVPQKFLREHPRLESRVVALAVFLGTCSRHQPRSAPEEHKRPGWELGKAAPKVEKSDRAEGVWDTLNGFA